MAEWAEFLCCCDEIQKISNAAKLETAIKEPLCLTGGIRLSVIDAVTDAGLLADRTNTICQRRNFHCVEISHFNTKLLVNVQPEFIGI